MSHTLTFNDNVFRSPLLVEGGEAAVLTDTDNMLSEVKVFGVKAEQAKPQLPHRLSVLPILGPAAGLQVEGGKINRLFRHSATYLFTKVFIGTPTVNM